MKDKISMPLIEAMLQYKSEDVYPLHTPGHKGGRGMQRLLRRAGCQRADGRVADERAGRYPRAGNLY